jgi:ATP-dependent DNA ligase
MLLRASKTASGSKPMRLAGAMAGHTSGIKAKYPGFIEPALATTITEVPSGARWLHEIKFDGYRVQVHI